MSQFLLDGLRASTDLPDEELFKLLAFSKTEHLKKGQCLIQMGQIPKKFAFVEAGLFRYYYADKKGNQFTKGFFSEGSFLSSYSAMSQQTPSYLTIEALEDAKVLVFGYSKWQELYEGHPGWVKFLVTLLEKAFFKKEERERDFLLLDAEERYNKFLHTYPGLENRIKQHLIASYLGITSVALSRIRKKMGLVNTG